MICLALLGVAGVVAAKYVPVEPAPPPAGVPWAKALKADGVVESDQPNGVNVNIFPEVSGMIVATFVKEGDRVKPGDPLFAIDDSVQRAQSEQLRLQLAAADQALLRLKAEPRPETVAVAAAQLDQARANLRTLVDQRRKLLKSAALDARSVSRDSLDAARDAVAAGEAGVEVARRQLDLVRAGPSPYEISDRQAQRDALAHAYDAAQAQLGKFVIKSGVDGMVLALNAPKGGTVSPFGAYDGYTEGNLPAVVLSPVTTWLSVRCYIDGAELGRLPAKGSLSAVMLVKGGGAVPLEFVRIQPNVVASKLVSSLHPNQSGLRVLPVIFRFRPDPKARLYPGQLVDVYVRAP